MKPIKKLKCGCYFNKDYYFCVSPECKTHQDDFHNNRPFSGIETEI